MVLVFLNNSSWSAQLGALAIVGLFTFTMTSLIITFVCVFVPIRVDNDTEAESLDLTIQGERAYDIIS